MNTKALVTLIIGKHYQALFNAYCLESWQIYAKNHGYDLIVFDQPLDVGPRAAGRSPAWQKCLVLSHPELAGYEQVVWMDADIIINHYESPCVCSLVPLDKVGAVDEFATPTPEAFVTIMRRLHSFWDSAGVSYVRNDTAGDYYGAFGFSCNWKEVVQTGVLVASPSKHADLFRRVYDQYEDRGSAEWNYEMRPLGYELLRADLIHWLDPRFNMPWTFCQALNYPFLLTKTGTFRKHFVRFGLKSAAGLVSKCLATAYRNTFFLHFSGTTQDMAFLTGKSHIPL